MRKCAIGLSGFLGLAPVLAAAACSSTPAGESSAPDAASSGDSSSSGSRSSGSGDSSIADGAAQDAVASDRSASDGSASDGSASDASGGDDSTRDSGTNAGPPTWSTQFVANNGQWPQVTMQPGGSVTFGMPDPAAEDNNVVQLLFPGAPGLDAGTRVGTSFATEIDTSIQFQYGTFRARLQLPTCDPTEDVVNGFFTYFNDGTDHNGNGIIDNSEIDIEILCGRPHVVSLSAWTDYTSDTSFLKMSRLVDLSTGSYSETTAPNSYNLTPMGQLPQFIHPEFPDPNAFYEMGFDWRPAGLRFFIVLGGAEITLWDYTDPTHIPTLTSALIFNVWHPSTHWTGDNSPANYPAHDAVTRIDWARYWK